MLLRWDGQYNADLVLMPEHDSCRTKRQYDTVVTALIIWSEGCSSLVAKYANAIGLQ